MDKLKLLYSINSSFIMLIILNIFDGMFTYIGLKNGFYIEKNIMLDTIFQYSKMMFIFIKLVVPTLILLILMKIVGENKTKTIKNMIFFGNTVYTFLFIYHIGLYSIVFYLT